MGLIVAIYLLIGAVCAALLWRSVSVGLEHRSEDAGLDSAMRSAEDAVGGVPGGMPTVLVVAILLWPSLLFFVGRRARR